jgi:hypothetical protein
MTKIKKLFNKLKEKSFVLKLSIVPFFCGMLYAVAGSSGIEKQLRRFGIPVLLTLFAWLSLKDIRVLTMLSQIIVYHIGHGIPDDNFPDNPDLDSGSTLGRFWTMLFRRYFSILKAHRLADYCTRGTKALLIALSCLVIPILKTNWNVYILLSILMIGSIASIAWRGLGEKIINVGKKKITILYVDVITGSLVGLYVMLILKF